MMKFKYLIIGGGMAADSASLEIGKIDGDGSIGMIADEPFPPYDRPPLSKGLWKKKKFEAIWRATEARGVTLFPGRKAVALDPHKREVIDDRGGHYQYETLLLATGGTPRRLPSDDSVPIYYRTLADYKRLRELADKGRDFVVVGGGFIGSEIAAALAMNGKNVTMAFHDVGICGRVFPPELSARLNRHYESKGVRIFPNQGISSVKSAGEGAEVRLTDGTTLAADAVVAGLGITPNVELAARAGLVVGNGIVVDESLRTSNPNIFAAGDVASFPCAALNKRLRVEHEDNANMMGAMAGRNMAGSGEVYHHLPYFYSDLFEIGYEAVGETDSALSTLTEWIEPGEKGVIFYLADEQVRGVLLWNLFGKVDAARALIASPGPYRSDDLKAWVNEQMV